MAASVNAMLTFHDPFELRNKWMAFRLRDGSGDGVIYDSKQDAVRHQLDERLCAYLCFRNCLGGTTQQECEVFLKFNRDLYDAGGRMPDPDDITGGPDPFLSTYGNDVYRRIIRKVHDSRYN